MRHLAAVVLVCAAAVACGNASPDQTELTGSTAEGVINPNPGCYSGYVSQCHYMEGRQLCTCVPLSCTWDTTQPPAGFTDWIESWTVGSNDGSCPNIKAPTGTWRNLSNALQCTTPQAFDGVPCEYMNTGYVLPQGCNPSNFGTPSCCTYVWWPADFVEDTSCTPGSNTCENADSTWEQFPQVLCAYNGMKLVANEVFTCDSSNCGGLGGIGGGGKCRTCQ